MNELQRKSLENIAMEAEEKASDHAAFANWGAGRSARASFAIALLQLDEMRRIRRALKVEPSGVAQEASPKPTEESGAAGDAGSSPAPAATDTKPRRKRRKRGPNRS